jgi:hypothetical protein
MLDPHWIQMGRTQVSKQIQQDKIDNLLLGCRVGMTQLPPYDITVIN